MFPVAERASVFRYPDASMFLPKRGMSAVSVVAVDELPSDTSSCGSGAVRAAPELVHVALDQLIVPVEASVRLTLASGCTLDQPKVLPSASPIEDAVAPVEKVPVMLMSWKSVFEMLAVAPEGTEMERVLPSTPDLTKARLTDELPARVREPPEAIVMLTPAKTKASVLFDVLV